MHLLKIFQLLTMYYFYNLIYYNLPIVYVFYYQLNLIGQENILIYLHYNRINNK